jgi:hypothetical protein
MTARRVLPIAAFVVALAALLAVRLVSGGTGATSAGESSTSAPPSSARAAGGVRFTDVTEQAGLSAPHSRTDRTGEAAMTAGAAVADVDADGDLDVYLTRVGLPNRLLLNDGDGAFTDATERAGVPGDVDQGSSAAAFADVDADGDADLVVTGAGRNATILYRNDGDGSFTDITASSGLDDLPPVPEGEQAQMHGATFADYDRDGRLDLLLTHWDDVIPAALANADQEIVPDSNGSLVCARAEWLAAQGFPRAEGAPPNRGRLYRNLGDGAFEDVSSDVGLPFDEIMGFTGSFVDVDDDGWDDLLITGDFCTSRLFRNDGGVRFTDVTAAAGVGSDENGMGSVITDFDGDGRPDWFVTSIGPVGDDPAPLQLGGFGSSGNRAFLNDGDGTFSDATDQLGLRNGGWGWGAAVEDFANDGRRQVVMTNGYSIGEEVDPDRSSGTPADDPLVFWSPEGPGFVPTADAVGLNDNGLGRALVPFDMDRDGDLDLLIANFGGTPRLYRNDSPSRHWVTVQLDDATSAGNRQGIGAKVTVTPDGGAPVTGWILGGGSYESQAPAELHVGLGDTTTVARIEVWWPGQSQPQVIEDVDGDQVVVVERTDPG